MVIDAGPVMSFLVLSEDGSKSSQDVVLGLAKRLLVHLDPHCQTQRIAFEPSDDLDDIVRANRWKNRRSERVRLYNRIAQKIRNEDGFVIHHVDADQAWSARTRTPSNNASRLESDVVAHVRRSLHNFYRDRDDAPQSEALLEALVDARLARLFRFVPYWEIEAWLYQNTEKAAALCPGVPRCRTTPPCHEKLDAWRRDRAALDEVEHVSDELCLGKAHNLALIRGYPTGEVVDAGKSLAAAVDAMLGCEALLHAIQRTYETTAGELEST